MPRQCGIATFTSDLTDAVIAAFPGLDSFVVAMNDPGRQYTYPARVRFEIAESDPASYRRASDFLNVNAVDAVGLQHEYGIFGGKSGSYLLALLRELRMPIVSTLHTIVREPTSMQRQVMDELTRLSERIVVMSEYGASLLREVHGVDPRKIDVIPHGIPAGPHPSDCKDRLGVEARPMILTFGLLSPDKGVEYVIDALPEILRHHAQAVYVVLGATHPRVKEQRGEIYRLSLEARALKLGVDSSLIFHDRFVTAHELAEFMSAADVYVTPYLNAEQIASGTLAYAVGSGKAVVSTPYHYARELLAEGRGLLVPLRDPEAIGRAVVELLSDGAKRAAMQDRAAAYGRAMAWPAVARRYVETFERACREHASRRSVFRAKTLDKRPAVLPEANLEHVSRLSDATGILQHAWFSVPRYEDGYCLDDNARALFVATVVEDAGVEDAKAVRALATRYLAFVGHAYNRPLGRFRNMMSYSRRWLEECGSEDSHGRALWALGAVVGRAVDPGTQSLGGSLFESALPAVDAFTSPRAWAYALLGIDEYLRAFQGDSGVQGVRWRLAERLLALYRRQRDAEWPWFEDRLTYCNARLPQALLVSGRRIHHEEMFSAGLQSLDWLASLQTTADGSFAPIGSNGFYVRGGPKADYDQQPVEACAMVSACLAAHRATGQAQWTRRARTAFDWFLGGNALKQPLYDPSTGGCRDGLHRDRVNQNQGAESTLSFLMALLEMRAADRTGLASTKPPELPA
ncbi:MAG TPA: glycosyltransferase family 4 protein [Polyangiaceae bacterium]|nr:glycosyltransferase family 4 protein [Polyangiaceae bacterium]